MCVSPAAFFALLQCGCITCGTRWDCYNVGESLASYGDSEFLSCCNPFEDALSSHCSEACQLTDIQSGCHEAATRERSQNLCPTRRSMRRRLGVDPGCCQHYGWESGVNYASRGARWGGGWGRPQLMPTLLAGEGTQASSGDGQEILR